MGLFPTEDPRYAAVYAEEAAMVDASELIADALERSGMSRADLARALGVSRSEVTARLRGERNITVRKLAETLHALGSSLKVSASTRDLSSSPKDAVVSAYVARSSLMNAHSGHDGGMSSGSRQAFAEAMTR
jgi:ribosome-binding protein aMBF1 (putative translation factor)